MDDILNTPGFQDEQQSNIFVYAGFIQPGKHQILIRDSSGKYYAREIVVDIRKRDIEPHLAPLNSTYHQGIRRYTSNSGENIIDLDGSVFMNFKRYTRDIIIECLKSDMSTSILEHLLDSEREEEAVQDVLSSCYQDYCIFFHQIAAQYSNFPNIALSDLKKVLI